MITKTPEDVIAEARKLLEQSDQAAAGSLAISDEYLLEGEWLHLIVTPRLASVTALDFVDTVEAIEMDLRKKFGEEILIVPAKP